MTEVVIEVALLAEVVKRAASVAPTRGEMLLQAGGIFIKIENALTQDTQPSVTVMATDNDVWYMEVIPAREVTGPDVCWRIPSEVFSQVLSKVPVKSGATVRLANNISLNETITLTWGTQSKAVFNTLDQGAYRVWNALDPGDMFTVVDLGQKMKSLMWASGDQRDPGLCGVGFGPGWMGCTDRSRGAVLEIDADFSDRFMVPGRLLAGVVPELGEVRIARLDNLFVVEPNPSCQIRTRIVPQFMPMENLKNQTFACEITFSKAEFLPQINRLIDFIKGDRQARMNVYIGKGQLAIYLINQEIGSYGDILEVSGSAETHERIKIEMNPVNLRDAIASFPSEVVRMGYNLDRTSTRAKNLSLTSDTGYFSIVAPLSEPPAQAEEA